MKIKNINPMVKANPFISYLRSRMIFEKPNLDELKRELDEKIAEIKSHEERLILLTEILKLWNSHDIDSNYKGGFMDFFNYAEYKLEEETIEPEILCEELYTDLINIYINDVSLLDFNSTMTSHRLPYNRNGKRIIWIGDRYEGFAFSKRFGFKKLSDFNKCFVPKNGKDFRTNDNGLIKHHFDKLLGKHDKS